MKNRTNSNHVFKRKYRRHHKNCMPVDKTSHAMRCKWHFDTTTKNKRRRLEQHLVMHHNDEQARKALG